MRALLHPGDSKQVQRVEMHGRLREYFAIQRLGSRELAALVMADRALEQRRDRRRRRPLSDAFPRPMFDHCLLLRLSTKAGIRQSVAESVKCNDSGDFGL